MSRKRPILKRSILPVLFSVLLLVGSVPVFGVTASDFTDRFDPNVSNADYWGTPYIDYAARVGIIEGYEQYDGTRIFLPRNNVTKQEAITMVVNTISKASLGYPALNAAGKDENPVVQKWVDVLTKAGVAEWAYPYVAYGLENGFITAEEALRFMKGETSDAASREEVITWVGRALWSRYSKTESSLYRLPYTDAEDVSDLASPYLALLSRIGIIEGNENADGTYSFAPKRTLTRVEFAVICNKVFERAKKALDAMAFLSDAGAVSSLKTNEDGSGTFRIGNTKYFFLAKAPLYVNGVPSEGGLANLENGETIVLSMSENGTVHFDTRVVSVTGKVISVRGADSYGYRLLTVDPGDGSGTVQYYVNSSADYVTVSGSLSAGKHVAFLADGVSIIELTVK